MTPNKIMELADKLRPNTFDSEVKMLWISQAEALFNTLIRGQDCPMQLRYPDDLETRLWLEPQFEGLYLQYLLAQMELHSGHYSDYNNRAVVFNTDLQEMRRWYLRRHRPPCAGGYLL